MSRHQEIAAATRRAEHRGMDSISLNNADRLRREAQRSAERSRSRTQRSWAAVGEALREQIGNYRRP